MSELKPSDDELNKLELEHKEHERRNAASRITFLRAEVERLEEIIQTKPNAAEEIARQHDAMVELWNYRVFDFEEYRHPPTKAPDGWWENYWLSQAPEIRNYIDNPSERFGQRDEFMIRQCKNILGDWWVKQERAEGREPSKEAIKARQELAELAERLKVRGADVVGAQTTLDGGCSDRRHST
jgi:hypothetical protein